MLDAYSIEPLKSFVNVPGRHVKFATSVASSREGFRTVFSVFDQTQSWLPTNDGRRLAATTRRNLAKVNGASVETPNAFVPGEGSVAERPFEAWKKQVESKTKTDDRLLLATEAAPSSSTPSSRKTTAPPRRRHPGTPPTATPGARSYRASASLMCRKPPARTQVLSRSHHYEEKVLRV
ncbi:hypothetical protein [Streptomyces celluloflavus]|uniref:hypothetical protein n=1 Tax=Streptomyces celluloflavus TaxID=58344 RepID=UPI00365C87A7